MGVLSSSKPQLRGCGLKCQGCFETQMPVQGLAFFFHKLKSRWMQCSEAWVALAVEVVIAFPKCRLASERQPRRKRAFEFMRFDDHLARLDDDLTAQTLRHGRDGGCGVSKASLKLATVMFMNNV
mmetsp:Transcript_50959/g.84467  ORF Transcript_50959/g.84467 Transcript_50959/m.84467 type:complete len:125 (-) Transcript_50959:365-739(-)